MAETNSFGDYGGYGHEVYEVYEDPINNFWDQYNDYAYPQSTSFSGGYFYDSPSDSYSYETTYDYYPTYCLYPNYIIYYPEIQVHDFSPAYTYYTYNIYYPVYSYYYVENYDYTLPASEYYDISSVDQTGLYESGANPSSVESNLATYEAFDSSLYDTAFGYHVDAYNYGNIVGEEQTTCYFFYEERHEDNNAPPNDEENNAPPDDDDNNAPLDDDDNNAPPDDEDTSFPSGSSLEQNAACNIPAANEIEVSQFVDQEPPSVSCLELNTTSNIPAENEIEVSQFVEQEPQSSNESAVREEETNENLTEPLSPHEIKLIKSEINRAYEHLKSNLFNDVDSGYNDMREFLKNIKWRYDHFKRNIAIRKQEEKLNRTYDMETYYFHDDLSTLRPRFRYQDDIEFYVLDQLLRSINVSDLKDWMENNYKKNKVIVYKKECKGHQEMEKKLQKLQWEPTKLVPIPEDEELQITEKEFNENFVKDLKNISRQKYIQKKKKKRRKKKKADVIETDCKSPITEEDPNQSSSSHESIDLPRPEKSVIPLCKEEVDIKSPINEDDPKPQSDFHENINMAIHEKTENLLCKEELKSESPITAEGTDPSSDSQENTDLPVTEKIEHSLCKVELDSESLVTEEDQQSSSDFHETIELSIPEKIEMPLRKVEPDYESHSIVEDLLPSVENTDRSEDIPEISLNEEERNRISEKIVEDSPFAMLSGDKENETECVPNLDVTEPVIEAAAQKDQPKKKFTSIRKLFSGLCCCRKKPPS